MIPALHETMAPGHALGGSSTGESAMLEIACDESGSEGDHLIGAETDVFAYASVHLDTALAAACVREIRDRIGSPALEYKAGHLLRRKSRPVLSWLFGPSGPLLGHAHVHLTDKRLFVVGRIVDLFLLAEPGTASPGPVPDPQTRAMAVTLHRDGRATWGDGAWTGFLTSFNTLLRLRNRSQVRTSVEDFFQVVDGLRSAGALGPAGQVMELLWRAKPRAGSSLARLLDNPELVPPLDPLIPAFVRTIGHWSKGSTPVSVVHDQQNTLTVERIARTGARLAGLTFVDSRDDPRVQVADYLAGVARKVIEEALNGWVHRELIALVWPYVDPLSTLDDDAFPFPGHQVQLTWWGG